jgi:AcrR family transcriptional regulator
MADGPTTEVESRRKSGKPTRSERNAEVRQRLLEAATHVVGEVGYAEASVADITKRAGVAQGTFYNHFPNRQALLDQLLPTVGRDLLRFIEEREAAVSSEREREEARFRGFFEFLRQVPEFLRILNEAESFAPKGYQAHFRIAAAGYVRALRRARAGGEIRDFTDAELEALVYMLMGAREYLSRRYVYSKRRVKDIPEVVISAYVKVLARGLFS